MNWDEGFERFICFLRTPLADAAVFDSSQISSNTASLELVGRNGLEQQIEGDVSHAFAVLIGASVSFCEHYQDPISLQLDRHQTR